MPPLLRKDTDLMLGPLKHQFGNTVVHQYQSANPPKSLPGMPESVERPLSAPIGPLAEVTIAGKKEVLEGPVNRPVNNKLLNLLREKGAHKSSMSHSLFVLYHTFRIVIYHN